MKFKIKFTYSFFLISQLHLYVHTNKYLELQQYVIKINLNSLLLNKNNKPYIF